MAEREKSWQKEKRCKTEIEVKDVKKGGIMGYGSNMGNGSSMGKKEER